ncbi:dihydrodipicolinate synthase family protein [Sphingomonas quercus]|uniref:Dihydrodipicolinate synthase family protein n=1 Tax=Sphingomonas quercus TaxID=2842451 RepID=A0ABS6BL68_9SPHN|nr:dihydrodipicolinate synthase family protein [Sphingomonas quercus]MBU3078567.1 dihydrodipicolinate synthase family protein [Sphingomonas quercus]
METTRRGTMGLLGGAAAAAMLARSTSAMAQARRLGSPSKTMYWVATVTPCDKSGKFDPGAMRAITQWHKSQGADGMVVLGTSGEFPSFSVAERRQVAETVLKDKQGLNIIIGPGTPNIAETIDLAKHAEANGADGLLVIPPFYFNQPPVEGLTAYYSMLFDAVRLPINLYHIPGTSEVAITADLLKSLMHYPHLAGIKDSSGNAQGFTAFVEGFPDLNMRCGTSNNLEVALDHGMGTILADGNNFSKECANIFKAYRAKGDWKAELAKLRAKQQVLRGANGGANTYATMKYVLSLEMGGPEMYARAPYVQLTDAQRASLKAAYERVKAMG